MASAAGFAMQRMSTLHFLYQYAVSYVLDILRAVLAAPRMPGNHGAAGSSGDTQQRLQELTQSLFLAVYTRVSRGLRLPHKLIFALLLVSIRVRHLGAAPAVNVDTSSSGGTVCCWPRGMDRLPLLWCCPCECPVFIDVIVFRIILWLTHTISVVLSEDEMALLLRAVVTSTTSSSPGAGAAGGESNGAATDIIATLTVVDEVGSAAAAVRHDVPAEAAPMLLELLQLPAFASLPASVASQPQEWRAWLWGDGVDALPSCWSPPGVNAAAVEATEEATVARRAFLGRPSPSPPAYLL